MSEGQARAPISISCVKRFEELNVGKLWKSTNLISL